jgi:hypothetical protein
VTGARTVLLTVLVLALAGCTGGPSPAEPHRSGSSPPSGRDASNQAEIAAVRQRLAQVPSVLRVDGGYSHDPSNAGGDVMLAITVRPGTDPNAVAEAAVRAVWLSRLTPVGSMTAAVGPDDDPGATIYRHVDFDDDRADLSARYGRRPVDR